MGGNEVKLHHTSAGGDDPGPLDKARVSFLRKG